MFPSTSYASISEERFPGYEQQTGATAKNAISRIHPISTQDLFW